MQNDTAISVQLALLEFVMLSKFLPSLQYEGFNFISMNLSKDNGKQCHCLTSALWCQFNMNSRAHTQHTQRMQMHKLLQQRPSRICDFHNLTFIFSVRKRSCRKVIFLHVVVCSQGVVPHPQDSLGPDPRNHKSRRYVSYWNAILFFFLFECCGIVENRQHFNNVRIHLNLSIRENRQ